MWASNAFALISTGTANVHKLGLPLAVLATLAIAFFSVGMAQLRYA